MAILPVLDDSPSRAVPLIRLGPITAIMISFDNAPTVEGLVPHCEDGRGAGGVQIVSVEPKPWLGTKDLYAVRWSNCSQCSEDSSAGFVLVERGRCPLHIESMVDKAD